jgi:hypothetical protein
MPTECVQQETSLPTKTKHARQPQVVFLLASPRADYVEVGTHTVLKIISVYSVRPLGLGSIHAFSGQVFHRNYLSVSNKTGGKVKSQ